MVLSFERRNDGILDHFIPDATSSLSLLVDDLDCETREFRKEMNLERNIFRRSCSMIVVKCWVAPCSRSRFGDVENLVGMQRNSFYAY